MVRLLIGTALLGLLFFSTACPADEPRAPAGVTFFAQQVEPIFINHCYQCHGNGKAKGGLNFYTREALLKGGDNGPAVDLANLPGSLLLQAINYDGLEMPPSGKLPPRQIEIITRWVTEGAPMPERTDVKVVREGAPEVNDETKNHWAFRPLKRPQPPGVSSDWVRNPIDDFVLARLNAAGLKPNPRADRRTLIRRLYYDLTGLPPTPEQVAAFVADDSPGAYEALVSSLLDSPRYGEHWARYWLDLVRYAESNSFERDNPKPFVWRYRDYVIRSLNDDKPYDRFLIEQLAGDELPDVTSDSIIATGYYRLGPWDDEPADPKLATYDELDDIITTTGQGILGLTLNCSRCHDHKLDPIPQVDYYRFLAFFQNIRRYGVRSDESVYERSVCSIASEEEQQQFEQELRAYNQRVAALRSRLDEVELSVKNQLVGGERDDFQADSVRLGIIKKYVGKFLSGKEFDEYQRIRREWTQLRDHPPQSAAQALCVKEHGPEALPTHVLLRGSPAAEGDVVEPQFPSVLSPPRPEIVPPHSQQSTGRRLALARWITSPENPLTARVMINRIWQWHFDRGIVRSSNNFGLQGDAPTHPELLDWLAAEFIQQGWSIKAMHRLILLSNTYQMSSALNPAAMQQDPQNTLLWRFEMRRLRAEELRDSILAVNHTLRVDRMYGPSIYPAIPEAVLAGQSRPGENWHVSTPEEQCRRSIYIHIKRSLQVPLLAAFDVADTDFSCPVRFATTQPTQALGMLNSEFLNEQAEVFAEDLRNNAGDNVRTQVKTALERTLQRQPSQEEIDRGLRLIQSLQDDYGQSANLALKNFCLVALNLNEFIYLD